MALFNLESLIKTPTCFQSECTDLILTNKNIFFKNSKMFEVRISDYHRQDLTSMRSQYIQSKSKIKFYRDYKSFSYKSFNNELNEPVKSEKYINCSLFENTFLQSIYGKTTA